MTSAIFLSNELGRKTKKFPTAAAAVEYAESVITDKHNSTYFHVCVDPKTLEFYLLATSKRSIAARWLEEQGFEFLLRYS